jgi:carboxymethylenebutenolidase
MKATESEINMGKPTKTVDDYDPAVLDLFDAYVHGAIDRRGFMRKAGLMALGGLTAASLLDGLSPDYVQAMEIEKLDDRIRGEFLTYPSPDNWQGYLAKPAGGGSSWPGVLVIHENRGRNPYIEDVTRRLAVAGFIAMSPDALTSFGGWTSDDEGRKQQRTLDRSEMMANWTAAFQYLKSHPDCSGKVGAIGFCYGGGVVNNLATSLQDLGAGVPFYGRQPALDQVSRIKSPLLIQNGELDERILEGAPAFEKALESAGVKFEAHVYKGARHGFHNNSTPRYDEAAAKLAWQRTLTFLHKYLT